MSNSNLGDITSLELNWKGLYSSTYSYTKKDLVYYNGDAFECLQTTSLGIPPTNTINWVYIGRGQDLLVNGGTIAYYSREGQSDTHTQGFGSFLYHNGIKGTLADPFVVPVTVKDWGGAGVSVNRYEINGKIRFVRPIEVERGRTYKIDQSDASNAGHPLYLSLTPKYTGMSVNTGTANIANPLSDGTNIKYYIDGSEVTEAQYHTTATFNAASTSRYIIWTVTNTPPDIIWYECSQHVRMGQPLHINQGPNRLVTMNRMRGSQVHKKVKSLWCGPPGGWFPYMPTRTRWIANQKENMAINYENLAAISQLGDVLGSGTASYSGHGNRASYELTRIPFPFWYRGAKFVYCGGGTATHVIDIDGNLWQWGSWSNTYCIGDDAVNNTANHQYAPHLLTFDGKCPGPNGRYDSTGAYKVIDIRGQAPNYDYGQESSMMVLMENGDIWTWGHNQTGNLGRGTTSTSEVKPQKITGSYDMLGSCHGGDNTNRGAFFARDRVTGKLWGWGNNYNGQLGVGDTTNRVSPVLVNLPSDRFAVKVLGGGGSAPTNFTFFLLDDGSLYSVGNNGQGILGQGDTQNRTTPAKIVGLETNVRDFYVFGDAYPTAIALMKDGTIRTWGYNYYGQLGIGTVSSTYYTSPQTPQFRKSNNDTTNYHSPAHSPIVEMAGAMYDSYTALFALRADGTVWSCGYNGAGSLGRMGNTQGSQHFAILESSGAGSHSRQWIDDDAPSSVHNSYFGEVQTTGNEKFISISSWDDSEGNGWCLGLTNKGDVWGLGNAYHNEGAGTGHTHRAGPQLTNIMG